jgi:hypothetical protein
MPDGNKGFAIQCPRCGKWNEHNTTVIDENVIVKSKDEFWSILEKSPNRQNVDFNVNGGERKLFRCERPHWSCPGPYQALIFDNRKLAIDCLNLLHRTTQVYAISRDFRLYKADKHNRWNEYHCIMFFTEPVHRLRHIELEHLMDAELLRRLITGISSEVNAPLTIYSANVFESFLSDQPIKEEENPHDVYWMPLEAYSPNQELIPAKYNCFCSRCRQAVMKFILKKQIKRESCGHWNDNTKTCNGKDPACLPREGDQVDWNHCPAFIDERKEHCPCYNADAKFIDEAVKKDWQDGRLSDLCEEGRCLAGFHEAAFPIIVHDHLVGVAMTGQVFFQRRDLPNVSKFVESRGKVHPPATGSSWEALKGHEGELEKMKYVLLWEQEELKKELHDYRIRSETSVFYFDQEEQYKDRLRCLKKGIDKVEEVASTRYRDIRTRSEIAFCEEMLGYIRHAKRTNFTKLTISDMLNRMGYFWAFKYAALLSQPRVPNGNSGTNGPRLLALSPKDRLKVELPYSLSTAIDQIYDKEHPTSWYYDPINKEKPTDPWTKKLFDIVIELKKDVIKDLPAVSAKNICYLLAIIPFEQDVYSFAFSERDTETVSLTERLYPQGISQLCREFILTTCTQMIRELGDSYFKKNSEE